MVNSSYIKQYRDADNALKAINASFTLYTTTIKELNSFARIPLKFILLVITRLYIRSKINVFKKAIKTEIIKIDVENYATFKKYHISLSAELQNHNFDTFLNSRSSSPWPLKGLMNDLNELLFIIKDYHKNLEQKLSALDSASQGEYLKHISADDLWRKRNKSYIYKV